MLSVLIPIYNYNTLNLVETLYSQLDRLQINFEIICICDASNQFVKENEEINKYSNAKLITLKKNIGRSKIRNLLIEKSSFNWLLFLDADVIPRDNFFVRKYINFIEANSCKVCCGGLQYKEYVKKDRNLRWVYGKKREEISVEQRLDRPYQFVTGANILIHKSIFKNIIFNEKIVDYGYEDVLFVEDLKLNGINIHHINNPVFHLGIENSSTFLNKTQEGIENLVYLSGESILKGDNLKLLKTFRILSKVKLNWILFAFFYVFEKSLKKNLLSHNPSLFLFDLYKLGYLCSVSKKE